MSFCQDVQNVQHAVKDVNVRSLCLTLESKERDHDKDFVKACTGNMALTPAKAQPELLRSI